jgi:MoaA/NifB/PqqE/SkfB family radical SAM enzyme
MNEKLTVFEENKALNRLEIAQKKICLDSRVTSLVVTLTTRCQIRCLMCEEYQIPWDIPENIVDEIVSLFPFLEQIIWQGGEVLSLGYFKDLLEEARRFPNARQCIITNAQPIDDAMADRLVNDNIELTVSIDGSTRESYERIRKGASFDKLVRNLRLINEVRSKKNAANMTMRMHACVMNSNYHELAGLVDFAHEYGFDALHLMPIWGNIAGTENIFYHHNEKALDAIQKQMPSVEKRAAEYGLNLLNSLPRGVRPPEPRKPEEMKEPAVAENSTRGAELLCHMPWKRLVINPAGNVCPACHCKEMAGNVLKESLAGIWNNEGMRRYRKNIVDGQTGGFCAAACVDGSIADELRGKE